MANYFSWLSAEFLSCAESVGWPSQSQLFLFSSSILPIHYIWSYQSIWISNFFIDSPWVHFGGPASVSSLLTTASHLPSSLSLFLELFPCYTSLGWLLRHHPTPWAYRDWLLILLQFYFSSENGASALVLRQFQSLVPMSRDYTPFVQFLFIGPYKVLVLHIRKRSKNVVFSHLLFELVPASTFVGLCYYWACPLLRIPDLSQYLSP